MRRRGTCVGVVTVLLLALLPQLGLAQALGRDTRTWLDPYGSGVMVTFSTPVDYPACRRVVTSDVIEARGLPAGWQLRGYVDAQFVVSPGGDQPLSRVRYEYHTVSFLSTVDNGGIFTQSISYPAVDDWLVTVPETGLREIHVDLSIGVYNGGGDLVRWVGGDLAAAPGTLGPGGQDWTVYCYWPILTLGGHAWYDQDGDASQGVNEPFYNGATVSLFEGDICAGEIVSTTVTGATGIDGQYQFADLSLGTYSVGFGGYPVAWSISPVGDKTDSAADPNGCIAGLSLTKNADRKDIGVSMRGAVGGRITCVGTSQCWDHLDITLARDLGCDATVEQTLAATVEADGSYRFADLDVALVGDSTEGNKTCYSASAVSTDPTSSLIAKSLTQHTFELTSAAASNLAVDFEFELMPIPPDHHQSRLPLIVSRR